MFKRLWSWLFPPAAQQPEEPRKRRSGMFSTDVVHESEKLQADSLENRMLTLYDKQPRYINADGQAQDSLDGEGPSSNLKSVFAITGGMPAAITNWFLSQTFIGHQMAGLLAQHWLIDKCCLVPARDAVRHGYEITTSDGNDLAPDVLAMMRRLDKRYRIKPNLIEQIYKGKIFGIRIAYLKIQSTDPQFYEVPFNLDGVTPGSYKGIVQVDPYWCMPELDMAAATDPASMHYYEPTYWVINNKRYHRSHLIIYREGDVVDILKPEYMYGGIPLPQKIMERVYAAERTANEAPQLAMTKRTRILQTELEEGLALGPRYRERLAEQAELIDNYGVVIGDKDDVYSQSDLSLADLDVVMMTQYQVVAATACVPGTKLMMTQPKGFNATGEYDEAVYHEELESIQEGIPTELVERHHAVMMISDIVPKMRKIDPMFEPITTHITWTPLDSLTEEEQANINKTKADTDTALLNAGALDEYDIRDRVRNDKHSGYTGIEKVERPDEDADGKPDAPKLQAAAPAPSGMATFDALEDEPLLITNQTYTDPQIVAAKRAEQDYVVQVSPVIVDEKTGARYRVVIDGHHSLEAARADGVAPALVEGGYGDSDYFDIETGSALQ